MSGLAAEALHVRLGTKPVLQGVSAVFAPGEVTAIIGPNGAGKSTLLACLAGLRRPDTGTVKLGEQPLLSLASRARAQRIGFLPQIPEVAWAVEVRTLAGLGRMPFIGARGLSDADEAAVDEALSLTGTTDLAHRNVATLSRAASTLARAAGARLGRRAPQWLLADEPLAGLDPGHQLDVAVLLRRLARQNGRGILITLHDLHMALRAADRVLVLAAGRFLADGTPVQALSPDVLAAAYGIRAHIGSAWPAR